MPSPPKAELMQRLQALEASEREAREAQQALANSNRLLHELLRAAIHELRAPLVGLKGFAEILQETQAGGLSPRGHELLERIHQSAVHMSLLLRGVQELNRLGEDRGQRMPVELGKALEVALEARHTELESRGVAVECAPDLPPVVAHPNQLSTLLGALLDNALKHHPGPGAPRVRLGWRREERPVYFLEDDGAGVPEELRERVFELFFRGSTKTPGAGVGLTLARRIAELHGGRMWVERGELGGARFCFVLASRAR